MFRIKAMRARVLPCLLIGLAFGLRVYPLAFQSLWRDEVDVLRFAMRPIAEAAALLLRPGENGPLFYLLLRPWLTAAGQTEFALRFPSAWAGTATVALLYALTRRLAGPQPALLAALFAATAPFLTWYSQDAKMYALITALIVLILWLAAETLRRGGLIRWAALYLVTSASLLDKASTRNGPDTAINADATPGNGNLTKLYATAKAAGYTVGRQLNADEKAWCNAGDNAIQSLPARINCGTGYRWNPPTTTAAAASTTTTISDGQGTDLLNLAEWDVYGSASADTNELIFGDSIGSDPQDQDQDGNPENTWMNGSAGAGPGDDYDWIVSKKEFSPPLTLTWSGCFPTTAYGYQYAALARKNPAFTGTAGSGQPVIDWNNMQAFQTSWEHAGALLSFTRKAGQNTINTVSGATPGGHGICGEFKIVWENNKATYYFNDAQVDQQDAAYFGPVRIFFRAYENPFSIDSITVLSASTNTTTTAAPVTSTTTAPETTTTTSISSVTTTIATPCPIQRTLNTRDDVDALRLLRDIRFMNAPGLFITCIYYKNSAEISAILEEHPELQQQMKALAAGNISVVRELVNNGAAVISRDKVDDITRFLEKLRQDSSPGLQADIQLIINGIKNRRLVTGIGVKVK
jgi:hypothetical protein